jgi:hypothetical protein
MAQEKYFLGPAAAKRWQRKMIPQAYYAALQILK